MADGTCAGASSGSSLFTDGGNTTYLTSSDVLGIGTTTAGSKLAVYGDLFIEGSSRYLNFGTATGTSGYGFRDNSGTLELKNSGGSWQGVTTATSGPSFSVHKNGTNQTVAADTYTKVTWSTERFDTNNNFDLTTERFTPTVPGKYIVTGAVYCSGGTGLCYSAVYKNGSIAAEDFDAAEASAALAQVTTILDMNGSTDYVELFGYNTGGTTISGSTNNTYFTGVLIAPVNATAGGWQNDGMQSFLADSTDKVGIGTSTPWAKLSVTNAGSGPSFVVEDDTSPDTTPFIIDASGNVGIGTASQINSGKVTLSFTTASHAGLAIQDTNAGSGNGGTYISFDRGGVIGTIKNTSDTGVAYNTTSDSRVKDNITTTTTLGLDALMRLSVRDFSFKSDPAHATTSGFIAQELYDIFPWAVSTNGDNGIDALGASSTPWGVDYGRITPLLAKSIQDLNLKLEDLATTTQEIEEGSFTTRFFASLFTRITDWFADATNGITDFFARRGHFQEQLCVGETCVTPEEFAEVFGNQSTAAGALDGESAAPAGSPASEESGADDVATTTSAYDPPSPLDISSPGNDNAPPAAIDNEPDDDTQVDVAEPTDLPADAAVEQKPDEVPAPAPELQAANDNAPAPEVDAI